MYVIIFYKFIFIENINKVFFFLFIKRIYNVRNNLLDGNFIGENKNFERYWCCYKCFL